MEAEVIRSRQALLRQTCPCRGGYHLVLTLVVGLSVTFAALPSSRPWVLLVGVLAVGGLIAGLNQRLDALAELLERDLKRAANDEENQDARAR